ncbi:phosphomannomutase/phosphoglucomutase [Amphiplicatus metriothermophilus]|uniref:Phosphomannomutase / phosphoglucomutase n=1 Tax=Amphiplicatus metriothermophilus TaxID=1519374 RepID=A0A239PSG6_9PROT|nr:phosphomannomutase/phosphoglucomutase [Amphiplicatus metriothermophilus]MBB5519161.1 phosphomannomutase/phosphoglucomutase [Amphiplicatus metriothermophilus]SNT73231.1 phosphomannomutase / phosphoglucomutase [Amphiplicatus metriothermophilus]
MLPQPRADLKPNTLAYETVPLVKPTGFREYDARWLFGPEINLLGVQALGLGLGTLIREMGKEPKIVVGHDFRSYSMSIKQALSVGLMSAGIEVRDIGLALSPVAYFAQFALDVPCVAMVTASHNENGWTGVKMGVERPLTFGPDEMARLKDIVLSGAGETAAGGGYRYVEGMREKYIADLTDGVKITRKLKVIAACGNGTAGAYAPEALSRLGVEVVPMDAELDHSFPKYNPNPEDLKMLHAMQEAVKEHGADLALGFDGDGDRCGVVDDEGEEIFADKIGVLLARDLSAQHPNARFVVDVKSTGLFVTDPVLRENGAETEYWKTGHSYIKRKSHETGALAGFEKSGHFFFNKPIGRGYDDGLVAAIAILRMLDRNPDKKLSDLRKSLPKTWQSPTMSPHCDDEKKYAVVERIVQTFLDRAKQGGAVIGKKIRDVVTVNGVRVTAEDGTWGLIRASSNKPELVVVVESPTSEANMKAMFAELDEVIRQHPEVGPYNQKI